MRPATNPIVVNQMPTADGGADPARTEPDAVDAVDADDADADNPAGAIEGSISTAVYVAQTCPPQPYVYATWCSGVKQSPNAPAPIIIESIGVRGYDGCSSVPLAEQVAMTSVLLDVMAA